MHRLRPLRRHLSIRRAEMQCERIRKLRSRWHRDELGAERKAARRKCSKALAPIFDIIIRKNAVHASLKGSGRFAGMPRMTLRLRYLTLKLRALCWVLAATARGAPFLARGVVSSRRKTSRVVIARTIIDGSTSDMMESSGVSDGKLARRPERPRLGLVPNQAPYCLTLPRQQRDPCRARDVRLGILSKLRQCPALAHNG